MIKGLKFIKKKKINKVYNGQPTMLIHFRHLRLRTDKNDQNK